MNKRNYNKVRAHVKQMPTGVDFIKYTANRASGIGKRLTKSTLVAYPQALAIEVTNQCNLRCITCARQYQHGKQMDVGYMEIDLLKDIVDQAYPYVGFISLTGLGESLLYKNMASALSYIKSKKRGIITGLSTNASLTTTEKIIKDIRENLDIVQISIDGIGDVYNRIRENGNYDLFLDNVKKTVAATADCNTEVMFNIVLTKENFHQLTELIDLAHHIGVKCVNLAPFNVTSTAHEISYYEFFKRKEFKASYNEVLKRAKQYRDLELTYWRSKRHGHGFQSCPSPWSNFYVTWDGYLVPCCAKPFPKELNFGNLREISLIECLNESGFRAFRKMWHENKTPDFCTKCQFVYL